MSEKIINAIQVAVQLQGRELSADALEVFVRDLLPYGEANALAAIERARREVPHRFALSDVIDRMPGGHPGVEEAWATVAKALTDERETLVMTPQMQRAFSAALNLQSDHVAARQSFKEVYQREVAAARASGEVLPRWLVSLGHDVSRRKVQIEEAVRAGKLAASSAAFLLGVDVEELKMLEPPATTLLLTDKQNAQN